MADEIYCNICRQPDEENSEKMQIQCDGCNRWYHCSCVNLEEYEIDDIDRYHCPSCFPVRGPSIEKPIRNRRRHDYSEPDANDKAVQSGTIQFVHNLKKRKFLNANSVLVTMDNGYDLTYKFLELSSFSKPILVKNIEGLGMVVPNSTLTLENIQNLIEPITEIDAIDVQRQHSYKMKFSQYLKLFRQHQRKRIYNVISLEFSKTKLSEFVKLPCVVDEISWVNLYWPKKVDSSVGTGNKEISVLNEHATIRPDVSKFCLISMKDAYTDFHIDFGGTSVWYHVIWGEKIFYLIEPTDANLSLYEKWSHSADKKYEKFLAEEVDRCYKCVVKPGETLFLPTGWIHAVLTPIDSLVFGGNFLHSFNIPLQLRVYEMELNEATPEKFMFPHFELLNWYASTNFLENLKDANDEHMSVKPWLAKGIRALVVSLKRWISRNQAKRIGSAKGVEKIESMTCSQLLKKLEKALITNEKYVVRSTKKTLKRSTKSVVLVEPLNIQINKSKDIEQPTISEQEKVVPGSFINAKKMKIHGEELPACAKSPLKISLKPGNKWGLPPMISHHEEQQSSPPRAIKIKMPQSPVEIDQPNIIAPVENVEIEKCAKFDIVTPDDVVPLQPKVKPENPASVEKDDAPDPLLDSAVPSSSIIVDTSSAASVIRKKVGFSLFDLNKSPSPSSSASSGATSPPVVLKSQHAVASSPPKHTTESAIAKVSLTSSTTSAYENLKMKIPKVVKSSRPKSAIKSYPKTELGTHLTNVFGVSKNGRVQKRNQKVLGEGGTHTEFVPELGHCRKDDEFIYPSLLDESDSEESRLMKKKQKIVDPSQDSHAAKAATIKEKKKKKKPSPKKLSVKSTSLTTTDIVNPPPQSSSVLEIPVNTNSSKPSVSKSKLFTFVS